MFFFLYLRSESSVLLISRQMLTSVKTLKVERF